jgi:oligopeptide/dipeptide ABC transporter ATP-binding protein
MPLLDIRDLRVYFRGEDKLSRAVDGIDLVVRAGEIVGLVGESGCGKSVSAMAVPGLVEQPPAEIRSGKILFQGRNLIGLPEEELRSLRGRQIGMVFQEPMTSLNPLFTIGDQIGETIRTHEQASRQEIRQRVLKLLSDVEIASPAERLDDYPHNLSGGQRQRVMIAMALACRPSLVIADEPTTALDVTVQAAILRLLRKFQHQLGTAILLITHNLGVVAEIADRVVVMYAGIIVESGSVAQIFHDPLHPYTMGLLAALPSRAKRGRPLYSIPGSVPDPAFKPPGCPFHPRCPYCQESCLRDPPPMCDFSHDHQARCPITHTLWKKDRLAGSPARLHPPRDLERLVRP